MIVVVLGACGKSSGGADWTKQPVKPFDGTVDTFKYQISLPGDWTPRQPPDDGWSAPTGDQFERPSVNVKMISLSGKLDDAIAMAGDKPERFVRKDQKPDGFSLTEVHNKGLIRATTFKKTGGDKYLWCTASQATNDGIPNFDAAKPALEAICDSIMLK